MRLVGGWAASNRITSPDAIGREFQAGIAVGRLHAGLFLEGEDGLDRVTAGAAVDAIGLEAELIEAALDLLNLLQGRRAFAAGKLLAEWRIAADEVAEMAKRQRVAGRRVVGVDRAEILPDQESRAAGDRQP